MRAFFLFGILAAACINMQGEAQAANAHVFDAAHAMNNESLIQFIAQAKDISIAKGETETTPEYDVRLKSYIHPVIVTVKPKVLTYGGPADNSYSYDADTETLKIKMIWDSQQKKSDFIGKSPSAGVKAVFCPGDVLCSMSDAPSVTLLSKNAPPTYYEGENAFGARTQVERDSESIVGITLLNLQTTLQDDGPSASFHVAPSELSETKRELAFEIFGETMPRPCDPNEVICNLALDSQSGSEPTLQDPTDFTLNDLELPVYVVGMKIVNTKTGSILWKEPASDIIADYSRRLAQGLSH